MYSRRGIQAKFIVHFLPTSKFGGGTTGHIKSISARELVPSFIPNPYHTSSSSSIQTLASEIFRRYSENSYHKTALLKCDNFKRVFEGKVENVPVQLNNEVLRTVRENRMKLVPIVKTIILCGRQNIPLRGHRDDGAIDLESENQNEGNFRELLKYRVDAGDQILHSHLKNASKNSSLTSKTTQNDLINCCGTIIEKKIVEEVNQSKYFSILVDETTDNSSNEQLSLCVRFVDREKCYLHEEFLRFVVVQDLSREALSKVVLSELWDLGLDISNLRGQGYDGDANMSGKFRGVQAQILKEQPLAYYMHCASHCLNLSLSKSCSVPSVRQTVDTVAEIAKYVRESSKRSIMMKEKISQICPEHKKTKLKTLCETR
ncbi:52 kDa repressor of the inhibitor of the protein kinase-like [Periplaneta americana]|uniref:52 kDa repressor of the inhibitor of the protein kinase-like n=1 Tax=Periplaneta americana TaxID=6978 RepID=UPI0037E95387